MKAAHAAASVAAVRDGMAAEAQHVVGLCTPVDLLHEKYRRLNCFFF